MKVNIMISIRLIPVCLMAASVLAVAQTAPTAPVPPSPPQAPAVAPSAPPAPPEPPAKGMHMLLAPATDIDPVAIADQVREQMDKIDLDAIKQEVKDSLSNMKLDLNLDMDFDLARDQAQMAREQAELAREQALDALAQARENWPGMVKNFAFAQQNPMPGMPGMPAPKPVPYINIRRGSAESLYERGLSALDGHRYDQALECFAEVGTRGGTHADGALYWKAYTLNKLGRRDDAMAALAELHKAYAGSRWLDDAKALEIEVKQSSGQRVSPESESSDDLKLIALEGLVQSDPDRAFPILEQLLKKAQSPNFKKRAIYVLALNNSPRAQQLLEQIARGGGNPDMQMTAIQYLGRSGKGANKSQVLFDIYNSSSDANVKGAILRALLSNRDKDHLLQIAKSDKSADMRSEAVRMLGSMAAAPEMWALYQSETDPTVKRTLLDCMSGSTDRLIEVAKTEKDAKLRQSAILRLGSVKAAGTGDALVQIYGAEQDVKVKRTIIDVLYSQHNAGALVTIGRKDPDLEMKKTIVRRLVDMKSPEATQFLEEILK
jgi:tetratricopeptide (TPR) repeat protein